MLKHRRNPRLTATYTVGFGILFVLVSTFTYITFYLADPPFNLSTEVLSYLFAIYHIGLVVTPIGGLMVARVGMRAGIGISIGACIAGALITLSHSLRVLLLAGLGLVCTGVFIARATANSFLRIAGRTGVSRRPLYLLLLHRRNGRRRASCLPVVAGQVAGLRGSDYVRAGGYAGCCAGGMSNAEGGTGFEPCLPRAQLVRDAQ
jgi:MFS transporter, YNFM family, putative membrane transport protein